MNSVLIVDDSKVICDLLSKIFSNMFFDVYVAENGEEALRVFEESKPKLIVMDYSLPIIEGIDVLYKIRNMEDVEQPKIIFCSSLSADNYLQKAIEAGCDDYIIKPFDEEIISLKLKILGVI